MGVVMTRAWTRILFPYSLVAMIAISLIAGIGMMSGLVWWQTSLWAVGVCLFICMIIFTFSEIRRLSAESKHPRRDQHGGL